MSCLRETVELSWLPWSPDSLSSALSNHTSFCSEMKAEKTKIPVQGQQIAFLILVSCDQWVVAASSPTWRRRAVGPVPAQ